MTAAMACVRTATTVGFSISRDQAFADTLCIKKNLVALESHMESVKADVVSIRALVYRLKQNENYKLIDSSYASWSDYCRNEFPASHRQTLDRMVNHEEVNRSLPANLQVQNELQARVLVQVPADRREEVIRGAEAIVRSHPTIRRKVSGKILARVASEKGFRMRGLPASAQPMPREAFDTEAARETSEQAAQEAELRACTGRIHQELDAIAAIWRNGLCRRSIITALLSSVGDRIFKILN